jgi:uncharacterized DUF497 family protein
MTYEWDEAKRRDNVRKHGIDFAEIDQLFDGLTVTIEDERHACGEQRFITMGLLRGRVVVVVHTERGNRIRIISVRKATKNEKRFYISEVRD